MAKAPDRIFATVNGSITRMPDHKTWLTGGWDEYASSPRAIEYVRADIVTSPQGDPSPQTHLVGKAEAFDRIVAARKAYLEAANAYNARVLIVRKERERGTWDLHTDHEYREMNEAARAVERLVRELADTALATEGKLTVADIETLKACDDWKATFEVIAIRRLPSSADSYRAEQQRIDALLKRGLLEFGRPNTTYRITPAGRAALATEGK